MTTYNKLDSKNWIDWFFERKTIQSNRIYTSLWNYNLLIDISAIFLGEVQIILFIDGLPVYTVDSQSDRDNYIVLRIENPKACLDGLIRLGWDGKYS